MFVLSPTSTVAFLVPNRGSAFFVSPSQGTSFGRGPAPTQRILRSGPISKRASTHATSYFTPAYIGGVCHRCRALWALARGAFEEEQRKEAELQRLRSEASALRNVIAKQKPAGENEQELKNLRDEVKRLKGALEKETKRRQEAETKMKEFQTTAEDATRALLEEGLTAKARKRKRH